MLRVGERPAVDLGGEEEAADDVARGAVVLGRLEEPAHRGRPRRGLAVEEAEPLEGVRLGGLELEGLPEALLGGRRLAATGVDLAGAAGELGARARVRI